MAQAKKYTARELKEMGLLSKRQVRKAIAAMRKKSVGQLPLTRLETAMRNQRSALAILGLIQEASDTGEGYYEPIMVQLWDAYLKWHPLNTRKTVIEGAFYLQKLVMGDPSVRHNIAGGHVDVYMHYVTTRLSAMNPPRTIRPLELVHSDNAAS